MLQKTLKYAMVFIYNNKINVLKYLTVYKFIHWASLISLLGTFAK